MKRPGLLIGALLVILLLCAGVVVLDQTGMLGAGQSVSSGGSDPSNPYGGLK